ncbi:MAG: acetylornithine transaminase [Cellvibrionaceae bacterium]
MNTYGTRPITMTKGEGAYLWDQEGRRYLDALTGIAVCGLGHCHPAVTAAVQEQAATLLHTSNLYNLPTQQQAGDVLCEKAQMDKVFFSNSGAEANEAAIKLARLWGNQQGKATPTIVVMENAFHGRTMATLTATGNPKAKQGFEPLLDGFVRVPFDDIEAVEKLATENANICAVLVEPVQGEGGVHIPTADYLPALRTLCDKHNWLLMLDEIQTGNGRTGEWFAWQHSGAKPDVMTTAKGLGNGMPIGACLATGAAAELFQPGMHGSTYGGNPVACAAISAVYQTLEDQNLVNRSAELGNRFQDGFEQQLADSEAITNIRHQGLMIGIELDRPCTELVNQAAEKGFLINVTAGNVVRLLPPFILSDEQADEIIESISQLIKDFVAA